MFTPSLFMGASAGYLFGAAVHAVWPTGAANPGAFALVGMGAFLAAASRAPVMAIMPEMAVPFRWQMEVLAHSDKK